MKSPVLIMKFSPSLTKLSISTSFSRNSST